MAGEQQKANKIRFNSWEYDGDTDKAEALMKNLIKTGRPVIYRGNVMCWLVHDDLGIRAEQMTQKNLLAELDKANVYLAQREVPSYAGGKPVKDKDGNIITKVIPVPERIPGRVVESAFGLYDKKLYKVRGVMTHPIINKNGEYAAMNGLTWRDEHIKGVAVKKPLIHVDDGYDPVSGYFFAVPERVTAMLEGIQDQKPTAKEVKEAVEFIGYFLCDFRFATESAKASAVAFMLTVLCQEVIKEYIPMLEVRAAVPHSGKSLLVKMMLIALTGQPPAMFTPNFGELKEFEQELFSILLQGQNYIFMDNVKGKVESPFLEMALKSGLARKRVLGASAEATVYSRVPFVMTANNPRMSEDMKNRVYLLDIARPPDNTEFTHGSPEEAALEMGPYLLKALFTLYNNWDKNHKRAPYKGRRMEGFIPWSETVGGILDAAGMPGFLEDTLKQIKEIDPQTEQAAALARAWHGGIGSAWATVKDSQGFAVTAGYIRGDETEQKKNGVIAARLETFRNAPLPGGYRFEKATDYTRGSKWRVVKDG